MNYNEIERLFLDSSLHKNIFEGITFLIDFGIFQTAQALIISKRLLVKKEGEYSLVPLIGMLTLILAILTLDYVFFFREFSAYDMLMRYLWIFCTITILHFYFEESILKKIVAFIISMLILNIFLYLLEYFNMLISDTLYFWICIGRNIEQLFFLILSNLILYLVITIFMVIVKKPIKFFKNKKIKNNKIIIYLCGFFFLLPTIIATITSILNLEDFIAKIIQLLFSIFLGIGVLEYFYSKDLVREAATTKDISEKQELHYKALERSIKKTNQLKHDIESHVRMLHTLQEDGMESQEFERDLLKNYAETNRMIYTNNTIIDSLIYHYMERFETSPVDLKVRMNLPKQMEKTEFDVHALLSRLFELASEQCNENQLTDRARIQMEGYVVKNYIFIVMECTKTDMLEHSKQLVLLVRKKNYYMKALKEIKNICHRNEGSVKLEEMDDSVKITTMMQMCQ